MKKRFLVTSLKKKFKKYNDLEEIFEETLEAFELKSYRVYYENLSFD